MSKIAELENELWNVSNIDFVEYDSETGIITGDGGFNVDWCDREGRHPWVDQEFTINILEGTIECKVNISSKDGKIDGNYKKTFTFECIENVIEIVEQSFDEMLHEMDQDSN